MTYGSSPALLVKETETAPSNGWTTNMMDGNNPSTRVEVHPLVLLSILDHHTRRQESSGRVIGTLLGRKTTGEGGGSGKMEITNCFAVPHAERGDEVAIGKDFNRQMLALHLRANRKEKVIGWYATALPMEDNTHKCIADTSVLIHDFYAGECDDDPIHLVVDTSLTNDTVSLKAYKSAPVQVKNEQLANLFHEIRLGIKSTESERICIDHMVRQSIQNQFDLTPVPQKAVSDEKTLQISMEKLYEMLEKASAYVDGVVDGTLPADDKVGRTISDTLSSVPRIRPEVFDKMFNDSLQDLLMVTYLSNITRTQLTIAEKLNAALTV